MSASAKNVFNQPGLVPDKVVIQRLLYKRIINAATKKRIHLPQPPVFGGGRPHWAAHSLPTLIYLRFLRPCWFIPPAAARPSVPSRLLRSASLLFRSSFPGNWVWVLLVEGKRLGWSCWELARMCVRACLCECVCVVGSELIKDGDP